MKYLEDTQSWDEYFSSGNTYREEITGFAQKSINSLSKNDPAGIYARLLLWKFHRDQNDSFWEDALAGLISASLEYAKDADNITPIKDVADQLVLYGERGKSKELYRLYVNKLLSSGMQDDELAKEALAFYNEGNLDLAEAVYDVYIDRLIKSSPKEKFLPILFDIAEKFTYKDQGYKDMPYAEKIYKKIEEVAGKEAFNQEQMYLRAFNLEKMKEYKSAIVIYRELLYKYPANPYARKIEFKIAVLSLYALRDIKGAEANLEKLASSVLKRENTSGTQMAVIDSYTISSLYQLGLIKQWEGNPTKAKEYYTLLIENVKDSSSQILALAKERMKEIGEGKALNYNLKSLMDTFLGIESSMFDSSKLELNSSAYTIAKNTPVSITSIPFIAQSGCIAVELEYFWAGDLGGANPSSSDSELQASYSESGTKIIGLVVSSTSGVVDRNLALIDVD
jgi:tetratricopeptide (TPR) repeat protein